MKRCPTCNTEYADSFKVCPRDGAPLGEVTVAIPAPDDSDAATVAVPPPVGATAPSDPMIGTTIANRFRVVSKLGEGGMGSVYKAEHTKMDRLCAIKMLGTHMKNDPDALARFTREANMSSRIEHPHAVAIYDYGEADNDVVYLAMEYVEGDTLSHVLRRDGQLGVERTLRIARQIGEALDAAHALGIVHRDLKPDNIMLARKGTNADFVKVLDFGIAKMAENEETRNDLTQAGLVIGTPFYMSPEQVSGQQLDARSDVYSFALIVYEMLSGSLPFGGANTQAVMVSRLTLAPRPLREANPHVSEAVEAAVMRALVRDRDARTATAGQFVRDLEDAASGRDRSATSPHAAVNTGAFGPGGTIVGSATTPAMGAQHPSGSRPGPAADPYSTTPAPQPGFGAPAPQTLLPTDKAPSAYPMTPPPPQPFAQGPTTPYPPEPPPIAEKKKGSAGAIVAIVGGLVLVGLIFAGAMATYFLVFKKPATQTAGGTTPTSSGTKTPGTTTPGTTTTNAAPTSPGGSTTTPGTGDGTAVINDEAYQHFQKGVSLQSAEKWNDAIAEYRQAVALRDQFPQAHGNLGAALLNSGKLIDAKREIATAIAQDPAPKGEYFFNLGLVNFKLEDYKASAEAFGRASALDPDSRNHLYRGFALDNAGDEDGAKAEYEKFLAMDPNAEEAPIVKQILAGKASAPTGPEA